MTRLFLHETCAAWRFLDTLYYRLNMVCVTLAENPGVALDADSTMNVSQVHVP
jgi:hypothetical protein